MEQEEIRALMEKEEETVRLDPQVRWVLRVPMELLDRPVLPLLKETQVHLAWKEVAVPMVQKVEWELLEFPGHQACRDL